MFRSLLSLRPWERFDQKRTKQKQNIGDKTPRRISDENKISDSK